MSNIESAIKSVSGIGLSIPQKLRSEVFSALSVWHTATDFNGHVNIANYFESLPKDMQKAIHLIQQALKNLHPWEVLSILHHANVFTNVMEEALKEQRRHKDHVQYVTTQPDYLKEVKHAAASAPIWSGSLFEAVHKLIMNAEQSVDIINPYWSADIVSQLFRGFDRKQIKFRLLTLISGKGGKKNLSALLQLQEIINKAGSSIEYYSPTDEQSKKTDAIAPIHAKLVVADGCRAYLGSANLSKGGLYNGLEIGIIHQGPTVKELATLSNWIFVHSTIQLINSSDSNTISH